MQQTLDQDIKQDIEVLSMTYRKFFRWAWHLISQEAAVWNWHIDYIANQLQLLGSYVIERKPTPGDLIINVPPGMTKSTLVTQVFPVWLWLHDPSLCFIISTYADGLSVDHSLKAKSILQSDEFAFFNQHLQEKFGSPVYLVKDTEKYWINNFGGFYYATSTGGTVTGKHAHLIIRDDPLNPEQADSKAHRERCNRFNDKTLSSRKKDKDNTPTVTVMQRLHEDDPTGHDLAKAKEGTKSIKHICLPARKGDNVKPRMLVDRYKDGLLDPVRLSELTLEKEKTNLGTFAFAGQYDQEPTPIGGGLIKEAWFEIIDRVPEGVVNFVIDTAYTIKGENDPCAILAFKFVDNYLYLLEGMSERFEFPELIEFVKSFTARNGYTSASRIFIELKSAGHPLLQSLKKSTGLNVLGTENPVTDKVARLTPNLPFIETGRVRIRRGSWNKSFIDEVCVFPKGKHDEFVDLLVYAINNKQTASFKLGGTVKQSRSRI